MKTILVTGAAGFIGRHLMEALGRETDTRAIAYDVNSAAEVLEEGLRSADVIVHLAGVNRPKDPKEFETGNTGFTEEICVKLAALGRRPKIIMTSSVQAALDNPYGVSKLKAEAALGAWAEGRGGPVDGQAVDGGAGDGFEPVDGRTVNGETVSGGTAIVFRLKNVFGKWCRPNYNSVTATFCHNIAHDLPISISDPTRVLELVYIDDVVAAVLAAAAETNDRGKLEYREVETFYRVTLGDLAAKIQSFRESRRSLVLPSFEEDFTRRLYATYLSYFDGDQFGYALEQRTDTRGCLAEFMKSAQFGQIFVSRTKPGVTRGNHYHHTKTEKFLVVEGEAVIRFRHVESNEVIEHRVNGHEFRVVDIPPGYVHSIENVGTTELVTLFWASEIFDPQRPDCYFTNVIR